jgi:dipeptidyl aminopeptidase/acylaminoacyl peptidase
MASAHKARTTTLLLLGADDGRVSPEQGKMWYHALKKNGVEAELLIFPRNRHVLNGTVEAQLVSVQRTVEFCVSHVATPES